MKSEITDSLKLLESGYMHKRAMRQLVDGNKFLTMIKRAPYNKCRTVGELKRKISEEREMLKRVLKDTQLYSYNYQLTIFDTVETIENERLHQIQLQRDKIKEEVDWLHKCLGICSNRNYFK